MFSRTLTTSIQEHARRADPIRAAIDSGPTARQQSDTIAQPLVHDMMIRASDTGHYCFPFNTRANEILTASATHSVLFQSPWPAPNSKRLSCAVPASLADPLEGMN